MSIQTMQNKNKCFCVNCDRKIIKSKKISMIFYYHCLEMSNTEIKIILNVAAPPFSKRFKNSTLVMICSMQLFFRGLLNFWNLSNKRNTCFKQDRRQDNIYPIGKILVWTIGSSPKQIRVYLGRKRNSLHLENIFLII